MNFRPDPNELRLWDTWMFADPDDRRMHLFYLANCPDKPWEWVGHAISDDLVHWQELPVIHVRRPGDAHDVGRIGTGMVFPAPNGGYSMSYTAHLDGPTQCIAFLHSDDLVTWTKRRPEPVIYPDGQFYETDAARCITRPPAFRDAYIHKVAGRYEALIGAHATQSDPQFRSCVARYRSLDNDLNRWEAMPPLIGPGVTMLMEVPEHFEVAGRHYLLWSTISSLGLRCTTPSRGVCSGTFYAVADRYEGPYRVPADNLLIGYGDRENHQTICIESYVGRTILWQDRRLLYHHLGGPQSSFALPKLLGTGTDGSLQTCYWPGIEALHARLVNLPLHQARVQAECLPTGQWRANSALCGDVGGGQSLALLDSEILGDLHLRCTFRNQGARRMGVILRDGGREAPRQGVAVQVDFDQGWWEIGWPVHRWCGDILAREIALGQAENDRDHQLDVLVRDIYAEVYVDGLWRFTRVLPEGAREGRVGFFLAGGAGTFTDIQAWSLEPMTHPYL